jgi:hypothetical protein
LDALARPRFDANGILLNDSFGDCKLGVEISGYLVQSEWNEYNTSGKIHPFDAFAQLLGTNPPTSFGTTRDDTVLIDPRP